jgi:ribosomal protein L24E
MFKEKQPKEIRAEEQEGVPKKTIKEMEGLGRCKYCGERILVGTEEYHMTKQCLVSKELSKDKEKVKVGECEYCGGLILPGTEDYHKSKQCILHKENEKFLNNFKEDKNNDKFPKNNGRFDIKE